VLVLSRSDTLWFIPCAEIHLSVLSEEQKKERDSRMEGIYKKTKTTKTTKKQKKTKKQNRVESMR